MVRNRAGGKIGQACQLLSVEWACTQRKQDLQAFFIVQRVQQVSDGFQICLSRAVAAGKFIDKDAIRDDRAFLLPKPLGADRVGVNRDGCELHDGWIHVRARAVKANALNGKTFKECVFIWQRVPIREGLRGIRLQQRNFFAQQRLRLIQNVVCARFIRLKANDGIAQQQLDRIGGWQPLRICHQIGNARVRKDRLIRLVRKKQRDA